jgi:hypothetical protein
VGKESTVERPKDLVSGVSSTAPQEVVLTALTARSFDPNTMHREIEGLMVRGALP